MRTSNKLILAFIVVVFGSFLAINGVLHHKYVKGDFVPQEKLWQENFVDHPLPKPRVIVFDGTIWVNLIPADSFVLAMPRVNRDPDEGLFQYEPILKSKVERSRDEAIQYEQRDDTLFVTGTVQVPIHRPFSEWYYRRGLPVVDVYASSFDNILLNHGQICLRGARSGGSRPAHLTILNSTLWIGMQYATTQHDPPESFDSLDVTSSNSEIVVNSPARIRRFNVILKDTSTLIDQFSAIDSGNIVTSADSRINLSGENLKKTRITVQ
jgi:hypothetical protein